MAAPKGLDLDALDKEAAPIPPYEFTLGGKTYTANGPTEIDWQTAWELDVNDIPGVLRATLGEEQWEEFVKHKLKASTLEKLVEAINDHFQADPGEGNASQPS